MTILPAWSGRNPTPGLHFTSGSREPISWMPGSGGYAMQTQRSWQPSGAA
jgi:hypothetical protein